MIRNVKQMVKLMVLGKTINDSDMIQDKKTDNELLQIYFRL